MVFDDATHGYSRIQTRKFQRFGFSLCVVAEVLNDILQQKCLNLVHSDTENQEYQRQRLSKSANMNRGLTL